MLQQRIADLELGLSIAREAAHRYGETPRDLPQPCLSEPTLTTPLPRRNLMRTAPRLRLEVWSAVRGRGWRCPRSRTNKLCVCLFADAYQDHIGEQPNGARLPAPNPPRSHAGNDAAGSPTTKAQLENLSRTIQNIKNRLHSSPVLGPMPTPHGSPHFASQTKSLPQSFSCLTPL